MTNDTERSHRTGPQSLTPANQRRLDVAMNGIQTLHPTAHRLTLTSSDQGLYGYLLETVELTDGTSHSYIPDETTEDIDHQLADLSWGAFGDTDDQSHFTVDIATRRITT